VLWQLYNTPFTSAIKLDENRVADAEYHLRDRYFQSNESEYPDYPISVLEVMIALARDMEFNIMQGTVDYDRTAVWFTEMISSLGLIGMTDRSYDEQKASFIIQRFLNREYEPNGNGGLFTVDEKYGDMRTVELWYQASFYLDDVLTREGYISG
jgi:hypothetical protein